MQNEWITIFIINIYNQIKWKNHAPYKYKWSMCKHICENIARTHNLRLVTILKDQLMRQLAHSESTINHSGN